jgi:hypothetical protein
LYKSLFLSAFLHSRILVLKYLAFVFVMEEVMNLWDRLSLTAKEDLRVDLSDAKGVAGGVLAAKLLTKRVELKPRTWVQIRCCSSRE